MNRFFSSLLTSVLTLVTLSLSGNPENHTAVHGSVQLDQLGSTLQITLGEKAIINWESFSIGAEETTKFIQPSQQAAVLNRVIGAKKASC